ncbi:DUF427 domain-containing protein [Rhodobium gokarnense]|uniref:Uncharacterized protein (DUF427 family) n=1 Tax=Rhodobium gokarnense TaxID=364296 RepID=A0ABT3HCK8_9HYPH|nr:DUF427 domain-containing protein [Rhodobium gokarnense]MCW2308147.1 uncharacterized protein (DUF427 family) [Rhodobium gokarnense]
MAETGRRIEVTPFPGRITVRLAGTIVAESGEALALSEGSYPVVYYVPQKDLRPDAFEPSAHRTHCPFKGDASYFHIVAKGTRAENAAWSYRTPIEGTAAIAGHVAFYPDKVEIEVTPAR